MAKRLYRSKDDRMIWGVCGGLATYFNIDPTIIRVVLVLLIFANGLGFLAYIILAIVTPLESSEAATTKEALKENVENLKESVLEVGDEIRSTLTTQDDEEGKRGDVNKTYYRRRAIVGIILVAVGIFFLIGNLSSFWGFRWFNFWVTLWPLVIVAIGLLIIVAGRR